MQQSKCSHCGAPSAPGQRFCQSCGALLGANCAFCGVPLRPGLKFCTNCGAPMGGGPQRQGAATPNPTGLSPSLVLLLVVVLTVFFAGVGGLIYWQLGQDKAKGAGPKISDIRVRHIGLTSATVEWKTDVPASSQVEYGRTKAYGSYAPPDPKNDPTKQSTGATSHSILISPLTQGTTYHFRVRSKDAKGNEAVSAEDRTFKTLQPGKERYNPSL
ncbi:MAG: hypothetical protein FJ013_01810 [Chloroflexi bacterium]|nr:hypothetical protein [Chloroflexota bacterium]MBM4453298.1 hypothetical protein [Chloroflexota bacterium]